MKNTTTDTIQFNSILGKVIVLLTIVFGVGLGVLASLYAFGMLTNSVNDSWIAFVIMSFQMLATSVFFIAKIRKEQKQK